MGQTLPTSDNALLAWSLNFSTKISATPTAFGLTAAQATAYATVHGNFATAMAGVAPTVRSKSATAAKNTARTALKLAANQSVDLVNGTPSVTNSQKISLGINVRVKPTPTPVPTTSPGLVVLSVSAWSVNLKLHDSASSAKRGKPPGVNGAMLFSYIGATPPVDIGGWQPEGMTGRTNVTISFANTNPPGTKVWFSAYWFNGRKESGPSTPPVSTYLQGGSMSLAA